MSRPKRNRQKQRGDSPGDINPPSGKKWVLSFLATAIVGALAVTIGILEHRNKGDGGHPIASAQPLGTKSSKGLSEMEINHAVIVTVELDLGSLPHTIPEALQLIERQYQSDDGRGRTFAILDAYGEPTPEGKVHMSMHVSTEKPGVGSLVFRKTGEVLWQSRIVPGTNATSFTGKNLTIFIGDAEGHTITVDGSNNPKSILDAGIKDQSAPVGAFWPDGVEREVTFIYSACGCPVKVMAKRVGERTARTKELPVIFPDDPAVVTLINRLMGWTAN
jgi:hypothetical protein